MAGSINLANVALGFDASKIQKGVDLSAGEMRKLNSIFKDSISPVDRYAEQMGVLEKAFKTGAISADRMVQAEAALAKKHGMVTEEVIKESHYEKLLAESQSMMIVRQKQLDSELALGISLRKQVATAEERHTAAMREHAEHLRKGIIDQKTYNRLIDQSAKSISIAAEPMRNKSFSMPWTEMHSAIGLVRQGMHAVHAVSRPVFDEMNRIDHINDQAHKLGMSYRDLNTIQLALGESSGASAEDISKAMQKLSIGVTEAIKTGKGAHADALKTLSLDAATIGGMKSVEQLEAITNAMQGIGSQSERLQLTMDLLGKSGTQLVSAFDEGGGKLAEMAKFADEVGLNLSGAVVEGINNANDSLGRLSLATQGWIAQLTGGAAPALGVIADHLTNAAKAGQGTSKAGEFLGDLTQNMYSILNDMKDNPMMGFGLGGMAIAAFNGKTQQELTMNTLIAQGKAEEQAKEKEEKAKQIKERQGMEEDAAKLKRDQEKADVEWLKDYEGWMTRQNQEVASAAKRKELEEEFTRRDAKIRNEADEKTKKLKKDGNTVTEFSAPTLRAGSVEAYKFMLAQKDKQAEQGEKMITIQTEIADTMNRQLKELESQAIIRRAR